MCRLGVIDGVSLGVELNDIDLTNPDSAFSLDLFFKSLVNITIIINVQYFHDFIRYFRDG